MYHWPIKKLNNLQIHNYVFLHTGLGSTQPDPAGTRVLDKGVEVPMGVSSSSGVTGTSLLYNEYPFVLIKCPPVVFP